MAKAGLLFVGTDDGLVLFSNPNNIGRWLRIGQPFRGSAVLAVWALPDNPLVVFAAVDGAGLQRSDDGGQSWRAALSLDAAAIAGRAGAAQIYLVGKLGEVYRSDDSGERWAMCRASEAAEGSGGDLVVAPGDARRLYLGAAGGVWTSADAGEIWTRYGTDAPAALTRLAASPAQPGLLYATGGGALYACAAADGQWRKIASPEVAGALAILAGKTPVLLLALAGGGIARSDDEGATWTAAGEQNVVAAIAPAPYHIDTAFAGGAGGALLASSDRGRTWESVKQGLPPIRDVAAARLA